MSETALKILAVDDDPDLLRLLAIRLKSAGYDVTAVESAEKALAQVGGAGPPLVGARRGAGAARPPGPGERPTVGPRQYLRPPGGPRPSPPKPPWPRRPTPAC